MSKHSQLPWTPDGGNKTGRINWVDEKWTSRCHLGWFKKDGFWQTVCTISGQPENKQANAEFIVRAVNCHYDLLEASKTAHEVIISLEAYKNGYQWAVSAAAKLNRAIQKAEG